MSENTYRSFIGVVQFDPTDREVAGKDVRNVTIRATGLKDQAQLISITVWPSHAGVKIEKGDALIVDGKFQVNKGSDGEGNSKTYFNVSASRILNLGKTDPGVEVESTDAGGGDDDGDDPDW